MFILASDFFEKTVNAYLKLEIRLVCKEFLAFKHVFIVFSKHIRWLFVFVHHKSWKLVFKTEFLVHNIDLNLSWQVEINGYCNVKKIVLNVKYFRFLMCKNNLHYILRSHCLIYTMLRSYSKQLFFCTIKYNLAKIHQCWRS